MKLMHRIWNTSVHEILAGKEHHVSGTETVKMLMCKKVKGVVQKERVTVNHWTISVS
jgi:hypothetical protein